MPTIWIPEEEWIALQAVLRRAEQVNWEAYERVRIYLLQPQQEPQEQVDSNEARNDSGRGNTDCANGNGTRTAE